MNSPNIGKDNSKVKRNFLKVKKEKYGGSKYVIKENNWI